MIKTKNYMITYQTVNGESYGCATYFTETLKEAKTEFRSEHLDDNFIIIKIEIL